MMNSHLTNQGGFIMACHVDYLKNDEGRIEKIQAVLDEIQRLAQAHPKARNPEALECELTRLTSRDEIPRPTPRRQAYGK